MEFRDRILNGIVLGLILFTYFLLTNFFRVSGQELFGWLGYVAYPLFVAAVVYRNELRGFLRVFKVSVLICSLGAFVFAVLLFVYLNFFSDFMIQNALEIQKLQLENAGVSEGEITRQMAELNKRLTPTFYLYFTFVSGVIFGVFVSVLAGFFNFRNT